MSKKITLVFGGRRGIGAASVQKLAESGYDAAYTYVSSAPNVLAKIGSATTRGYEADTCEPAQVAQVLANVARDFGSMPHCVVANAGIKRADGTDGCFRPRVLPQADGSEHRGRLQLGQRCRQKRCGRWQHHRADHHSMVRVAVLGGCPSTANRAAVESLLLLLSEELALRKIRVNGVAPGPVDTDLFRAGKDEAIIARSGGMSPFNRVGQPDEAAEVVAFLASDKASWTHGQIIQQNGDMV